MNSPRALLLTCLTLVAACAADAPEAETPSVETAVTAAQAGPTMLALHRYNPTSAQAHREFLGWLGELNVAVAAAGHPETQYRAWRVSGDQSGPYAYLFGSLWADRATYDAVHRSEGYLAVMAEVESAAVEPIQEEVYNQYVLLSPPADNAPAMAAGDGPTYASVHFLNLAPDTEDDLVALLEELNEAVAAAGHAETRYGLWRVEGEQSGDYRYMFGSLWADRAAYDAVHADPGYVQVQEAGADEYASLVTDEVYNRYERVRLGG